MVTPFPDRDYPIVIGIDFGKFFFFLRFELNKRADFFFSGTTYSGSSYGYMNDKEITDINKW